MMFSLESPVSLFGNGRSQLVLLSVSSFPGAGNLGLHEQTCMISCLIWYAMFNKRYLEKYFISIVRSL